MFTIPTSTASTMLANASATLGDSGVMAFLGIVIGVPFAFWVIHAIIGIIDTNRQIEKADKIIKESDELLKKSGFNSRYTSALKHYNSE